MNPFTMNATRASVPADWPPKCVCPDSSAVVSNRLRFPMIYRVSMATTMWLSPLVWPVGLMLTVKCLVASSNVLFPTAPLGDVIRGAPAAA
jgi:hypothetical protein